MKRENYLRRTCGGPILCAVATVESSYVSTTVRRPNKNLRLGCAAAAASERAGGFYGPLNRVRLSKTFPYFPPFRPLARRPQGGGTRLPALPDAATTVTARCLPRYIILCVLNVPPHAHSVNKAIREPNDIAAPAQ